MPDQPKPNQCKIHFNCAFSIKESCVYFRPKEKGNHICKHEGQYKSCTSLVAQANALTVLLKKIIEEDPYICPDCGAVMKREPLAFVEPYFKCEKCGYRS